jgi:hypothetical protein
MDKCLQINLANNPLVGSCVASHKIANILAHV